MLRFTGTVRSGKGHHSELVIPGAQGITDPPPGWPERFHPGSLNVGIPSDGYPRGFAAPETGGKGVTPLDDGVIEPAVVLPWDKIGNNRLRPKPRKPHRGTGQFWRATLTVRDSGEKVDCWVFRRIDSTINKQLELVSPLPLKQHLGLRDDMEVAVELFGKKEEDQDRTSLST